jgi:hypothetical protein
MVDPSLGLFLELLLASPMNTGGGQDGWPADSKDRQWGVEVVGMQC